MSEKMGKTVVTANASLLSQLLYERLLEVPWHQRQYDWSRESVNDLLIDFEEACREDRMSYFLGAIVLVEKADGIWEISDGQQRIITYSLICARLARLFADGIDPKRESIALRNLFELPTDHTESLVQADRLNPRVTPSRNNKVNYQLLIRGHDIGANGKLTAAWSEIDKYFLTVSPEKAKTFFDYIIRKLEVVCIAVPRGIDPNSVFETLNARGKGLEDFDLIRNHIYSFFNDEDERQRRLTLHEGLEQLREQFGEGRKTIEYARCFLQSEYGYLPKDRLYRETKMRIKRGLDESSDIGKVDYVYDLATRFTGPAPIAVFNALASPREDDAVISRFARDCRRRRSFRSPYQLLHELRYYKVTQPISFALLMRYVREVDGQVRRALAQVAGIYLHSLTSFVVRTALVSRKFAPSEFEGAFADLAHDIMKAESLTDVALLEILQKYDKFDVFDDEKFIEQMKQIRIRENGKAKRFLLALAHYQQEDLSIVSESKYTVEHVLPTSPEHLQGWSLFDAEAHRDNVHLLGNLTLLSDKDNRPGTAYNRNFESKKASFGDSLIELTREISQLAVWSPTEIYARQLELAKLACVVWDFPRRPSR